ncbi:MAG: sugar phosphorylase [Anaerolineae bacterium]|nr:sugar phosphorylase [Anaerolineae bacterium]
MSDAMREKLVALYGTAHGTAAYARLRQTLDDFRAQHPHFAAHADDPAARVSERDVMLITYSNSLQATGMPPLQALYRFLTQRLNGVLSAVHILPFFPFSSDDGFSVIDYMAVDPALGTWTDIQQLGHAFKLMFDAVINHISAHSAWFQGFKAGDRAYQDFFITVNPTTDLSAVMRPRNLPLLTAVDTAWGAEHVWTTFSDDQIDLNFAHPDVLLRILDVLLFYVAQGMTFIRLDAIAYMWKEIGTNCIHLWQTHTVIKLMRDVLNEVAPHVAIVTETNVPHEENVSYFGDGTDEAQLVYQFTLPPLTLHAFVTGDATILSAWAASLEKVSDQTTFFNFTASHDGIGVRPVEGILSAKQIAALVARAQAHGGAVSYKTNGDGTQSPYELNINYFDALSDPAADEPVEVQVRRFIASQAIQLAFMGMPGIYVHSLLGSRNWNAGVAQTGHNRAINREKLHLDEVEAALDDPASLRAQVFRAYRDLIACRVQEHAFHPNAPQTVLHLDARVLALLRQSVDGSAQIVALHNVANATVPIALADLPVQGASSYYDLVSGAQIASNAVLTLEPYQVAWLKAQRD